VFVAAVAGLPAALAGNLVNAIFLAAGLVTLTQSTRLVRLPVVEGPSAAFDGLMIGFGKAGQLAMATTGLLIGGAVVLLVAATGLLGRVRRLFSPSVTGAVILLTAGARYAAACTFASTCPGRARCTGSPAEGGFARPG